MKKTKSSVWNAILWGFIVSVLFSILGAAIGASIINSGAVRESATSWLTLLIWGISIFCGVMLALKMGNDNQIIPVCFLLGGYILLNICVNLLFGNQYFVGFGRLILASLVGSGVALLLNFNKKKGIKHKIRYH